MTQYKVVMDNGKTAMIFNYLSVAEAWGIKFLTANNIKFEVVAC
jgi:hypothetical protein